MMLPKLRKLALGTFTESRHAGWLVILDFSCWWQPWFIFGPYLAPLFSALFNGTSATQLHTQPVFPLIPEINEKGFYMHTPASLWPILSFWPGPALTLFGLLPFSGFLATPCFLSQASSLSVGKHPSCWSRKALHAYKVFQPWHRQDLPQNLAQRG